MSKLAAAAAGQSISAGLQPAQAALALALRQSSTISGKSTGLFSGGPALCPIPAVPLIGETGCVRCTRGLCPIAGTVECTGGVRSTCGRLVASAATLSAVRFPLLFRLVFSLGLDAAWIALLT